MRRWSAAVLAAAAASGCAGATGKPDGTAIAAFFPATIDGHVTITQGGTAGSGSSIDVADDLGLENKLPAALGLRLDDGPLRLGLEWLPFRFRGDETLSEDVLFRGATFAAGDEVESALTFVTWSALLEGAVIENDSFELRAGGGAYWWKFDLELDDQTTGVSESRAFSRLLPAATASTRVALGAGFAVRARGAFATLDEGRRIVDGGANVEYQFPEKRIHATLGYRWIRYWLNEDTNTGMLDLRGPSLGITVEL